MTLLEILMIASYLLAAATLLWVALPAARTATGRWPHVAGLAAVFIAFSLWTVAEEGVIQFWINHSTTLAGNQVWFDLLIAVVLAFLLMLPRARALGMPILPWALAVAATASIALLVMLARILWLEQAARARQS